MCNQNSCFGGGSCCWIIIAIILLFLFCGGLFVWSEQQAAQISTLVEERGVPSAEILPSKNRAQRWA